MIDLKSFQQKIEKHIANILVEREKFALSLASDAIALVSRRVQSSGIKSDDSKFKVPYSQRVSKKLPPIFLKYANKNNIIPSYENYRKYLGLPTSYRNLTLTGKMWASIDKEIESNELKRIVVSIKSKDENQKLVNINSLREKTNILSLSKKEKEFLRTRIVKFFNDQINKL